MATFDTNNPVAEVIRQNMAGNYPNLSDCTVALGLPDYVLPGIVDTDRNTEYLNELNTCRNFFLRHDSRRYSANMRNRINNMEDPSKFPIIIRASIPTTFDQLTEVKSGGTLAYAVVWPNDDGRTLLCVHTAARRKHYGSLVLDIAKRYSARGLRMWVHNTNTVAQLFLLANGMLLGGNFTTSGGICYESVPTLTEDGAEDLLDGLRLYSPDSMTVRPERAYVPRWGGFVGPDEDEEYDPDTEDY